MTSDRNDQADVAEQQHAETGNDVDGNAYRTLFDALDAVPAPQPSQAVMSQVRASVDSARRQRDRERVWLRAMVCGLAALFLLTLVASFGRLAIAVGEIPLLYPFSGLLIATVGLLTNKTAKVI